MRRGCIVLSLALAATVGVASESGAAPRNAGHSVDASDLSPFLGGKPALADRDRRPVVAPSAAVRAAMTRLPRGTHVSYNTLGTPSTITRSSGWLATGLTGTPVQAARRWLTAHRALFGLTSSDLGRLQVVNDAVLTGSKAHAVLLRQSWAGVPAGNDGLVAVGIVHGDVASVTSTLRGGIQLDSSTAKLSALQAVLAAAHDDGRTSLRASNLRLGRRDHTNFTIVDVAGMSLPGRARLVALPTATGARLAYETDVTDLSRPTPLATISFVDALTGRVLVRHNVVDSLSDATPRISTATSPAVVGGVVSPGEFTTTFSATACGPKVPLRVPVGTVSLQVTAAAENTANDIALNVIENGVTIGTSDEATSPEAVAVSLPTPSVATDVFQAQVCPSPAPLGSFTAPYTVIGGYNASNFAAPTTSTGVTAYPPIWKYFPDSPALGHDRDTRTVACWTKDSHDPQVTKSLKACQQSVGNTSSRAPWDVWPTASQPSFNTTGNNATEAQAWFGSTLTPGEFYHPVSPTRNYTFPFSDQWFTSKCSLADFTSAQRADIDASATNLFVGHNVVHDFSYRLGYTERNYNNQIDNFGLTNPAVGNDPEIGDVQSGAVTNFPVTVANGAAGGALPVEGRDNANQVPEQDGVPGITNQYLFQPLVGFYGPCHDGDFDMSVYGHEYTHEISNRMIAGPDTGLGGQQGGSMGESWSDLDALELLHELGYAGTRGENPDSVGAYVTGNNYRGIRDFPLSANPLNYSDFGFDTTGPEVHADGEIWNGVQWGVRTAMVKAWNGVHPASNQALQHACATGTDASGEPAPGFNGCPGNRRWIQFIYDSFLLQANGNPTMIDMKNVQLAAAKLRDGSITSAAYKRDFTAMADAFARGGLGSDARTKGSEDTDPVGGFTTPVAHHNAFVRFRVLDQASGKSVKANVYVGAFQARVTPTVSTFAAKGHAPSRDAFVAGSYSFLAQAHGYGEQRFRATYAAGRHYVTTVRLARNYASKFRGARINGPGVRLADLIDDTEATDAGYNGARTSTPIKGKAWTVALGGGKHTVGRISVSAQHHPVNPNDASDFQGRLLDLRSFLVQVSSNGGKSYRTVYTSPASFFPGGLPRPVVPDLILRSAQFRPVKADHVRLVIETNQCTGNKQYRDTDADPTNDADCTHTADAYEVTAAEFQVYAPKAGSVTTKILRIKARKH